MRRRTTLGFIRTLETDAGGWMKRDADAQPYTVDLPAIGDQPDLFGATAPSTGIVGLIVVPPSRCPSCSSPNATIGSSAGPHAARLTCIGCGRHRGWLSAESFGFIAEIANKFGRPTTPIVIRRPVPPVTAEEPGHSAQSQPPIKGESQMGNRGNYAYGSSKYLKAADLVGKTVNVTVGQVEDVKFEQGLKPVLTFDGKDKGLVVNATNFDILSDAFGGYTENWVGKLITVAGEKITVKGVRTDTIKVHIPAQPQVQRTPQPTQGGDEEVPF
jgi:hypothetical protein